MDISIEIQNMCRRDSEAVWFLSHEYSTCLDSRWIIPDTINGKIPGFMLLVPTPEDSDFDFTIYFTYVRREFRHRGILKDMLSKIPIDARVYLETSPGLASQVWEKCGFSVTRKKRCGNLIMSNHLKSASAV